jgi:hypothetical protein
MSVSAFNLEKTSPHFKTIWSIGSTSSGASTFNGGIHPVVSLPRRNSICNPLLIGTDQTNDYENIRLGMIHLAQYGPVLLVNSIGYSIDGGKSKNPGPYLKEVTEDGFSDTKLVGIFAQIVRDNPELAGLFWVFNRNYGTPYGKMGGQWANLGYHLLYRMQIPNYQKYKYIADVGGGSVTFYYCDGEHFREYKNIEGFMSKKNGESPNMCYASDSSGGSFASKFVESIANYPEITSDNLLILQTGKMRENNVGMSKNGNGRVSLPNFPFTHYYLDHHFEVECECMDLVNSITQNRPVSSIQFIPNSETIVSIIINSQTYYEWMLSMWHTITCGFFL